MFARLLSVGTAVGKAVVGYASSSQKLFILVQQHGKTGLDANGVRAVLGASGVNNAVFLDCSDSATLFYNGKFLVRPGTDKNEFLTVAVGFK